MKRKAIGIIFDDHPYKILPNRDYGLGKHGEVRLVGGRKRLTKGMRQALKEGR